MKRLTSITCRRICGVALSLVVAASLAACGGEESSSSGSSIAIANQSPALVLPAAIAEEEGLMAQEGIGSIEWVSLQTPEAMMQAVKRGEADAAVSVPPTIMAANDKTGSTFRFFRSALWFEFPYYTATGLDIPVATTDNWEDTVKAWKGLEIGVPVFGGSPDLMTRAMLEQVGLSDSDVDILAVGVGAAAAAALKQGTVDILFAAFAESIIQEEKTGYRVLNLGIEGPDQFRGILGSAVFTTEENIEDRRGTLSAFSRGWQTGVDFMLDDANKDDVIADIMKIMNADESLAEYIYSTRGQYDSNLESATMTKTIDGYVNSDIAPAVKETGDIFSPLP